MELDDGNYAIPPNNLLRWHNPDFIVPYSKDEPPKVKIFNNPLTSEDIDRSYGNSPYFFYNHYPEEDNKEAEEHTPLRSYIYQEDNKKYDDIPEYPSA